MSNSNSNFSTRSHHPKLPEATVVEVVSSHPAGIAGSAVVSELVQRGYRVDESRRAVRVSIDKGAIEAGREFLLFKGGQ